MAQFRLDGFAIVVGAAGGIGREVALTFVEAGARGILLADINSEAVAQVAEQCKALVSNPNVRCISTTVDVTDVASVEALANLAKEKFGRIDHCVNAAGVDVSSYIPFDETDPNDYDRVLGINTKGVFLVTRAVARVMKSQERVSVDLGRHGSRDVGRGAIVNVSSAMAFVAVPGKVPYATSKHAITGTTKAAVADYRYEGIRINDVNPIHVRTPMFEEECRKAPGTLQVVEKLSALKRPVEPDEVASACLYLCSPSAVYLNGISLRMDSGFLAAPVIV
ncbi:NAD(P)-binding protein [Hypoxylon sp. FL1857]|nr:NAD(P)-binding protein [Hypoxylon sp. FL1857]